MNKTAAPGGFKRKLNPLLGLFCLSLVGFYILISSSSLSCAKTNEKKNVLILNSYHIGFKWTDDITKGILSVLETDKENLNIYREYMDTKRVSDEPYFQQLYEIYKHKFGKLKFDVLVCSDDNAFNFLRKYRDEIFPGTPVVFCGVNYFKDADLEGYDLFTGVNEEADIKSGIEIALKLHPNTRQIFVVNDRTTTGLKLHEELMEIIADYQDAVQFTLFEDVEMATIQEKLRTLPENSLVFYTIFFRDKTGRFFEYDESMSLIAANCNAPIYGSWDFSLGFGIVGGMLTSGYYQGETAARMALRILQGENVDNIPVIKESPNRYMFEYEQLGRFDIKLSDLPEDSILINKPRSLYSEYKGLVWGVSASIAGLSFIIFILSLNILKRRRAEEKLAESEKKYRSIFENALEGIFQTTPHGCFISANPSMTRILGYDSFDELSDAITDVENQLYADPHQRKELLHLLQEQDMVRNFECQLCRKNGSVIWVSIQARALRDSNGELTCLEGLVQDISERKRAAEALENSYKELEKRVEERTVELRMANEELQKAKEVAEAATRARGEFLATMSHEIRTPMNGIIAAADLTLSEKLPPKTEHYLKIIHTSAYSLLGIINDILDFSKIEAGKLELETRPFRLDEVLNRVTDVSIHKAAEKGIELLVDIDLETPNVLIGDPLRLQQIFTNLVGNAVKFTEKGGVILMGVRDSEKSPDLEKTGQAALKFFVKDTGVGIAPEHLRILFKPFTQADASTTRKYGGTGLGLSICKQLVEMMEGKISVESKLGKGSTFSFTARFGRQPSDQDQERKLAAPPDIKGLKVLVVDDCEDSRVIMEKLLASFGFQAKSVSSGEASLRMLKENQAPKEPFELVMMDWLMPGLDGIETSKRIRKDLKLTSPIILMTAFGTVTEKMDAEKAGINGFLTKPINRSTLFDAIMDAFGKEALRSVRQPKPITTEASIYKKRLEGVRILVAEDNPTNQEIALAVLEGAGIVAEIAKNGKEAVEAVQKKQFDAVLMDIQMPEMDGYEATRTIRKDARFASLPVIAMTAHAMKGDEEKCLNAGMDGYVSKPINQDRLFHTLWKSISPQKRPPQAEELEVGRPEAGRLAKRSAKRSDRQVVETGDLPVRLPGINIQDALSALNIDNDTFKRILVGFLRNNRDTMTKISAAFDRNDWESLRLLAHSLKGSAANIGANALQETAQELEMASKEEAIKPPASLLFDNLETALNQVLGSLQTLVVTPKAEPLYGKEPRLDPAQLIPILEQLANALDLADPEKIKKHMEVVKEHLDSAIFQDLEDQVNDYDYDEALRTLKRIAENIGRQTN